MESHFFTLRKQCLCKQKEVIYILYHTVIWKITTWLKKDCFRMQFNTKHRLCFVLRLDSHLNWLCYTANSLFYNRLKKNVNLVFKMYYRIIGDGASNAFLFLSLVACSRRVHAINEEDKMYYFLYL